MNSALQSMYFLDGGRQAWDQVIRPITRRWTPGKPRWAYYCLYSSDVPPCSNAALGHFKVEAAHSPRLVRGRNKNSWFRRHYPHGHLRRLAII